MPSAAHPEPDPRFDSQADLDSSRASSPSTDSPSADSGSADSDAGRTVHVPVMLAECLEGLDPRPGQWVVDGTVGGGGHARGLAEAVGPQGRVLGLDRDPAAIRRCQAALDGLPVILEHSSYVELGEVLSRLGRTTVHGILLDLGLSSDQLADRQRGFSYESDGPLDLRFDPTQGKPAWQLLAELSPERLADVIYQYGEERFSRRVARRIAERRRNEPIRTARQLAELVRACVPRGKHHRIDPATRTFQALRIAVNDELSGIAAALARFPELLEPGGRCAILSFHSLEDRLVKQAFREDPRWQVITRKPLRPSEHEQAANPRCRSAKLRIAARSDSDAQLG